MEAQLGIKKVNKDVGFLVSPSERTRAKEERNKARDTTMAQPGARRRMRHQIAQKLPEEGQQQILKQQHRGNNDEILKGLTSVEMERLPSFQRTAAQVPGTTLVKTVKSTCPKMDFTDSITGNGNDQNENPAENEILAEFHYIVELPKSHENRLDGGGVYDIISAMETRMHRTLVADMLDCSVGGLRRRQRQLQFGLKGKRGSLRVVGVNSAPLDYVTSSVACTPTKTNRVCLGMKGAITLTYIWEGDKEEEYALGQAIESARLRAVGAIRMDMENENGDYLDPSPIAPILRVSFIDSPSVTGLERAETKEERGAESSSSPFAFRSARYSQRIRAIVITAGLLLLLTVYVLIVLNRRIRRKKGDGSKGKDLDALSSTGCSDEVSSPMRTVGQQSMMILDSVRDVWSLTPAISEPTLHGTRGTTDSSIEGHNNEESPVGLGPYLSDNTVAISPTDQVGEREFCCLRLSKSDSFATSDFSQTGFHVKDADLGIRKSASFATEKLNKTDRKLKRLLIDKEGTLGRDSGVLTGPVRQNEKCGKQYENVKCSSLLKTARSQRKVTVR